MLRRWSNVKPTLFQYVVFAGMRLGNKASLVYCGAFDFLKVFLYFYFRSVGYITSYR